MIMQAVQCKGDTGQIMLRDLFDAMDCVYGRVDGTILHEDAFHITALTAKYVQIFDNQ
jgi:hypothetical protein